MDNPFHIFKTEKKKPISRLKKTIIIMLAAVAAFLVWFLYVINGLRVFVPYTPWITGLPFQSKNYLIVLQNEAELRPGGGFMTAYGVLRFTSGIPTAFEINDVFSLSEGQTDYIEPPYPMGELLKSPFYKGWAFQDANWYADFPTNAEKMVWFYNKKFPQDHIDGVMAVNFNVVEDLLDILGEVRVGNLVFNRSNLFSQLEYNVSNVDRHNVDDLKTRKNILKDFYGSLIKSVIFSPVKYNLIANTLAQHMDSKDIQFYFQDAVVAKMVNRKGWDGKVAPLPGQDFLAVIEANLAGMKSDRYLKRSVEYNVNIDAKKDVAGNHRATATLKVHMQHFGDYNEPLSYIYQGFVRFLLPKNSLVLEKDKDTVEGEESGLKFIGEKVEIKPQDEKTLELKYVLPEETLQHNLYHLTINKQSGTDDIYSVTVHAPPDFVLSGEGWDLKDNVAFFSGKLQQDLNLSLEIQEDQTPPRVSFQIFKNLQTIEIHFNEAVDRAGCENENNYTIQDSNKLNSDTDVVHILSVSCQDTVALFTLRGVTSQPQEQYSMTIKNIQDIYGNVIAPNPRTITVVQNLP